LELAVVFQATRASVILGASSRVRCDAIAAKTGEKMVAAIQDVSLFPSWPSEALSF
jgi:hypothetical protein